MPGPYEVLDTCGLSKGWFQVPEWAVLLASLEEMEPKLRVPVPLHSLRSVGPCLTGLCVPEWEPSCLPCPILPFPCSCTASPASVQTLPAHLNPPQPCALRVHSDPFVIFVHLFPVYLPP